MTFTFKKEKKKKRNKQKKNTKTNTLPKTRLAMPKQKPTKIHRKRLAVKKQTKKPYA